MAGFTVSVTIKHLFYRLAGPRRIFRSISSASSPPEVIVPQRRQRFSVEPHLARPARSHDADARERQTLEIRRSAPAGRQGEQQLVIFSAV
jgi:hypothetical protein